MFSFSLLANLLLRKQAFSSQCRRNFQSTFPINTNKESLPTVIIGLGITGSSILKSLSSSFSTPPSSSTNLRHIIALDRNSQPGLGISARNSGVIHSGIYYPHESKKSFHCINGRKLLIQFCDEYNVEYRLVGKIITAPDEVGASRLKEILSHTITAGVSEPLRLLSKMEVESMEPNVSCAGGLLSPGTGIVNVSDVIEKLITLSLDSSENNKNCDVDVIYNTKVVSARKNGDGNYTLTVKAMSRNNAQEEPPFEIEAARVINCAGLSAPYIFNLLTTSSSTSSAHRQPIHHYYCKGTYFKLKTSKSPFNRLIYPIPPSDLSGLGVHSTLNLSGECIFGPDTEWLPVSFNSSSFNEDDLVAGGDYEVDESRRRLFYDAVKTYYPALNEDDLIPDYVGIRPKLSHPNLPEGTRQFGNDFYIEDEGGWINLFGIESPGVTSSLSIADEVRKKVIIHSRDEN